MSITIIVIYVVIALFVLAFALRIVKALLKFIYDLAPILVPLAILGLYLYSIGELDLSPLTAEMEVKSESHIGAVKDKG